VEDVVSQPSLQSEGDRDTRKVPCDCSNKDKRQQTSH
jgi:hypothetical protein